MNYDNEDVEMTDVYEPEQISRLTQIVASERQSPVKKSLIKIPHSKPLSSTLLAALILDTNFILSHLSLIDSILRVSAENNIVIVVPWAVIRELDYLKNRESNGSESGLDVATMARRANRWLSNALGNADPALYCQPTPSNPSSPGGDDAILHCCESVNAVLPAILLTNDQNLAVRAFTINIPVVSYTSSLNANALVDEVKALYLGTNTTVPIDYDRDNVDMTDAPDLPPTNLHTPKAANSASSQRTVSALHLISSPSKLIQHSAHSAKTTNSVSTRSSFHNPPVPSAISGNTTSMILLKDLTDYFVLKFSGLVVEILKQTFPDPDVQEYMGINSLTCDTLDDVVSVILKFWISTFSSLLNSLRSGPGAQNSPRKVLESLPKVYEDVELSLFKDSNESSLKKIDLFIDSCVKLDTALSAAITSAEPISKMTITSWKQGFRQMN
ncbi:hypothetical protein CANCADRAFT_134077 [Tortispora caseinolytica NRRL Y-17796]|uniref:PIN domain-containing protein n=1 Tax=Tortispora caseinolytica NRRL Y-17796 TaxID=767744 RepID=A0A1E4TBJ9_9ASCO|nr:hypothetical protein CANCADRAFT_134077 [Tortispora caseinolytica NRRL Y-17796]